MDYLDAAGKVIEIDKEAEITTDNGEVKKGVIVAVNSDGATIRTVGERFSTVFSASHIKTRMK